jgi:hypothetical protein
VRRRPVARGLEVVTNVLRIGVDTGERQPIGAGDGAVELATSMEGVLAVVTSRAQDGRSQPLEELEVVAPGGSRQLLASTAAGFDFLRLPRFSSDGGRVAFAAGGSPGPSQDSAAPAGWWSTGPRRAAAHGARAWVWIAHLGGGELRRIPTDGFDDLAGLAWLPDGARLLVLDALGFGVLDAETGAVARVSGSTGTAFAWQSV